MPAKKQITREQILNAAFEIVKESGIDGLDMRSLAKRCGCSTQPIYLSFSGMEELKTELSEKILNAFDSFIEKVVKEGKFPEYKAVGMGYVLFAKQERQLFRYLFIDGGAKSGKEEGSFAQYVNVIMKNYPLTKNKAEMLHLEMWVFVHGIASMFVSDYVDFDEETVSAMLTDVFTGLMKGIKGENE